MLENISELSYEDVNRITRPGWEIFHLEKLIVDRIPHMFYFGIKLKNKL